MRVVIGDRFRRWSSSSIALRSWVTGILLVTHDSSGSRLLIYREPDARSWLRAASAALQAASLCAGHAQQFGGESPPANLMEVKA